MQREEIIARANKAVNDAFEIGAELERKKIIDKACAWLEELADGFIIRSKVIGYDCDKKFLIEDFKQRMEK